MLQKLLIYRTTRMAILFLIFIGVNYRSMAESKDLPKDLTNRITIKVNRVSLKNALDLIAKKGKVSIIYSNSKELTSTVVSVNVYDKMIKDVFYDLLNPLPFGYKVIDDKIVISFDPLKNRPLPINQNKTPIDIKGRVTDNLGNSIPGATVRVKDGNLVTATNKDGAFELHKVAEGSVIIITVVGYSPKEIIASSDFGIIVMEVSTSKLDEVKINAGYYSVSERERTGSISKVTSVTIDKEPINNPLQSLQGTVPGVLVTQTTGVPGGGFTVRIRGQNSISSGNDPLYIIDGVNFPSAKISSSSLDDPILSSAGANPLSMINPGDIESIEILKDADATAIYGSRGANGVVLITTKKGRSGNPQVNAKISQGISQVAHQMNLLNTDQYLQMRREAFGNDGLIPDATQYDVNGTWDQTKYTNWQKELIGGTANMTNATASVSGGNATGNYLVSSNYDKEGTVFPGSFGYSRFSLHSNLSLGSITDRFSATFSTSYSYLKSDLLQTDLTSLILLSPNAPDPYDQYGSLNWSNNTVYVNPMAYLLRTNSSGTNNLVSNITLNYRLFKGLIFKVSAGYNLIKREELIKTPLSSYSPAFGFNATNRVTSFVNNSIDSWLAEPQVSYKSKLGPGSLDALLGLSFQQNNSEYRAINGSGFNSDALMESITSAALLTPFSLTNTEYRYTAVFARINYNLQDKYYLNVTARRDGSSRFGEGNQFANFGAVGAAWVFSDEKLIKEQLPILSFGKLRASYGVTGNDQIADYGYLQLWNSSATYQGISTITPSRLSNPNYGWETNRKIEAALQLGFIQDRLSLEISYFTNRSSNQLVGIPLPLSTGFQTIQANLPAEVENTGWEFETNFKVLKKENWQWSAGFNLSIPHNRLVSYPGLATSTNAFNYVVGRPLTVRMDYNVTVNSQTGLYVFEDKDGNGARNDADRYISDFIGPKLYGGLQNAIRFKQINLSFLLAFTKQTGLNYMSGTLNNPGRWLPNSPFGNQSIEVLNRWQHTGDEVSIQRFGTASATSTPYLNARTNGSQSISDASFIRLKNVALSIGLPKQWVKMMKVSQAEISLQGQNLFTITGYKGLDPEIQSLNNLPPLRTLMVGLNLKF